MLTVYLSFIEDLLRGSISPDEDFKMMLVTEDYSPDETAHTKRSHITFEVSGDGYITGGSSVSLSVIMDIPGKKVSIRTSQVDWDNATIGARGCVVYRARDGNSSSDELVCFMDFEETVAVELGTFSVPTFDVPFIAVPAD